MHALTANSITAYTIAVNPIHAHTYFLKLILDLDL